MSMQQAAWNTYFKLQDRTFQDLQGGCVSRTRAKIKAFTVKLWPERAVLKVWPLVRVAVVIAAPGTTWYCSSCSTQRQVRLTA